MALRDSGRSGQAFGVDEAVRRILADWGRERDSDIGRVNLSRAAARLSADQKLQLVQRLAEISLGVLLVIESNAGSHGKPEPK